MQRPQDIPTRRRCRSLRRAIRPHCRIPALTRASLEAWRGPAALPPGMQNERRNAFRRSTREP
jgi:hypothetical protein